MGTGVGGLESTTLTLIGYAGTFIATVATGAWWFRGIKADLEKLIGIKVDNAIDLFGETVKGIQTKVNLLELEVERNFVRRSDFQNTLDSLNRSIDGLRADIKSERAEVKNELGRLNDKLDEFIKAMVGQSRT